LNSPSPVKSDDLVEEAKIVRLERPRLPEGIYATGLEGQVVVRVEIDSEGTPLRVKILRSTNDLLEGVVIDAVNRSEFSPRRLQSGPVGSAITIPFTFRAKR
jgi:TonB family protein